MKISKTMKMALVLTVMIATVGMASAQASATGEYAESDTVTEFDTVSNDIYLQFDNVNDEDVAVEFLNDDEIVTTEEDISLDSSGESHVELDSEYDVDQVRVYPEDTDADDVDELTVNYDFDGTSDGEDDVSNYESDTVFDSFEAIDPSEDPMGFFEEILPWIILIAIVGVFTRSL